MPLYNMFQGCSSLTKVDISKFIFNDNSKMGGMFYECSDALKNDIKNQNKGIKDEAFLKAVKE